MDLTLPRGIWISYGLAAIAIDSSLSSRRPCFQSRIQLTSPSKCERLNEVITLERCDTLRRQSKSLPKHNSEPSYKNQDSSINKFGTGYFQLPEMNCRILRFAALSSRDISQEDFEDWKRIHELCRRVVHDAYRIDFGNRGVAHEAVDKGRWFYN